MSNMIWKASYFFGLLQKPLRMRDIYDLKPSEIIVRKIHKKSLKTGKYENYPLISKETEKIAEQLVRLQGRFLAGIISII